MKRWQILVLLTAAAAGGAWVAPGWERRPIAGEAIVPPEPVRAEGDDAVVLLLDTSCSMDLDGRLEHADRAAQELAGHLAETARFGVIAYGDEARTVIPLTTVRALGPTLRGVDTLRADGGSNLWDGLHAARAALGGPGRIVVVSDGAANVGETEPTAFAALARAWAAEGVVISTVGLGPDADGAVLGPMADSGGGTYQFVQDAAELPRALAAEGDVRDGGGHGVDG